MRWLIPVMIATAACAAAAAEGAAAALIGPSDLRRRAPRRPTPSLPRTAHLAAAPTPPCTSTHDANVTTPKNMLLIEGDFLLGALVSMRSEGCSAVRAAGLGILQGLRVGLQAARAEAIRGGSVIPGLLLLDDCGEPERSLHQATHFIKGLQETTCGDARRVWGVLGAGVNAPQTVSLLGLFNIPQISYEAQFVELSNKARFEYFSRSIPSDAATMRVLADLTNRMGWQYVSVLQEDSRHGQQAFEVLEEQLLRQGICVASRQLVAVNVVSEDLHVILQQLAGRGGARVVLVLADERVAAAVGAGLGEDLGAGLVWVGAAGWWGRTAMSTLQGALAIQPHAATPPLLHHMLQHLTPRDFPKNPWFTEYYEEQLECSWGGEAKGVQKCSERDGISLEPHPRLQFVVDAVLAFAHSLRLLQESVCGGAWICDALHSNSGAELLQFLRKAHFKSISGHEMYFDENGDPPALYDIIHYRKVGDKLRWVQVGNYIDGELNLNVSALEYGHEAAWPTSKCSVDCLPGQAMRYIDTCCWICYNCSGYEIVSGASCVECASGSEPDLHRMRCVSSPHVPLPAAIPTTLAILTLLLTIFIVFLRWVKGNSDYDQECSEMVYLLMGAVASAVSTLSLIVPARSHEVCAVQRILGVVGGGVLGAGLIGRTLWLRGAGEAAGAITPVMVVVEATAAALWQLLAPAHSTILPRGRMPPLQVCRHHIDATPAALLLFHTALLLAAAATARLPLSNIKVADLKYVDVAASSGCLVWMVIGAFFATSPPVSMKAASLAAASSLVAILVLICTFGPKIYKALTADRNQWLESSVSMPPPSSPTPQGKELLLDARTLTHDWRRRHTHTSTNKRN